MTLVVTPSKLNLLKEAKPLCELWRNSNVHTVVVDQSIWKQWHDALRCEAIIWKGPIEWVDRGNLVVIGLDKSDYFVASYRGELWPHIHICPQCGTYIRCECPFGEMDFDDCLARCAKCKKA